MCLKPAVKALRFRRHSIPFYKKKLIIIIIYLRKTKDKFSGSYYKRLKTGTWYTSYFDTSRGGYNPQMEPVVNTST